MRTKNDPSTIGGRIKILRQREKITQKQLAEAVGISYGYMADLEQNRKSPSAETVDGLRNVLHTTSDYIFYGDEPTDEEAILAHFRGMNQAQIDHVMESADIVAKWNRQAEKRELNKAGKQSKRDRQSEADGNSEN